MTPNLRILLPAILALSNLAFGLPPASAAGVIPGRPMPGHKDYPLTPVPFTAVQVRDAFWLPRMETIRRVNLKTTF